MSSGWEIIKKQYLKDNVDVIKYGIADSYRLGAEKLRETISQRTAAIRTAGLEMAPMADTAAGNGVT